MTSEFTSLLPNPSPVERAIEREAVDKYRRADPAVIRTLFDPMTCPIDLLPWLAYSLSVDVWNPKWPEATKRAVCKNSLAMHIHKGTRGGVEDALAALGVRPEIKEWWETNPKGEAGTMSVTLWVTEKILPDADILVGADLINDITEQLNRSKRASIHYTFRIAIEAKPTGVKTAFSGQLCTLQHLNIEKINHAHTHQFISALGASAQLVSLQKINANAEIKSEFNLNNYLVCSAQVVTIHKLEARV